MKSGYSAAIYDFHGAFMVIEASAHTERLDSLCVTMLRT